MKIKEISYSKTFQVAMYCNEKLGLTIELDNGEDEVVAYDLAKKIVHEQFAKNNPHLLSETSQNVNSQNMGTEDNVGVELQLPIGPPKGKSLEDKFLWSIQNAETIKELEMFKSTANNPKFPNLKEAYEIKFKQLNNE